MKKLLIFPVLFCLSFILLSCSKTSENNEQIQPAVVRVNLDLEPRNINSKYWTSNTEKSISSQIFQALVNLDPNTYDAVPQLAISLPIVEIFEDHQKFNFEIRPDAVWPDGKKISARDVEFTVKFAFNPVFEQYSDASFYDFIEDVLAEDPGSQNLIIKTSKMVPDASFVVGSLPILPSHLYDPEGVFNQYSIAEFKDFLENGISDSSLQVLSEKISADINSWAPYTLIGSGPYFFEERVNGQSLTLKKVDDWWGNDLQQENDWFLAYPDQIQYKIFTEPISKVSSLEKDEADFYWFSTSFLSTIQENPAIMNNYELDRMVFFGFVYLGLNKSASNLQDPDTRKAINFLINRDELINYIQQGYGQKTNHPFFGLSENAESQIKPQPGYNLDSANYYLERSGWTLDPDSDIRNRNGEELELVYMYASNNRSSEETGILLKDKFSKAGIRMILDPLEFGAYVERKANRDFDLTRGGVGILPRGFNYRALFHSSSIEEGQNYFAFGNSTTDLLMDSLENELDPKASESFKVRISNELNDSFTWLVLYNPELPVVVSKRVDSYSNSPLFNGIWPPSIRHSP